jgi:hypothetical protein
VCRVSCYSSVQEAVRRMTGRAFSRQHLCTVLGICGAVEVKYVVDGTSAFAGVDMKQGNWRNCVLHLNPAWPPTAPPTIEPNGEVESESTTPPSVVPVNRKHVPIETKLVHFR